MPRTHFRRQAPRSLWGHAPRSFPATGATLAPGTCPTLALGDRRRICSGGRLHHVRSSQAAARTPATRSLLARGEQHSLCAPLLAREQNKQQRNDRPTPKNLRQAVSGVRNRALHLHLKEPLLTRPQGERLTRRLQRSQEGRGRLMDELGFFLGASSFPHSKLAMFPAAPRQRLHNKCSSIASSRSVRHLEPDASDERAADAPR